MKQQTITIHSDGGSRGNPGMAAYGFIVRDSENNVLHEEGGCIGIATNNIAEYTGVAKALEWASINISGLKSVEVILDSELVARQMEGIYKVKNENIRAFYNKIKMLEKEVNAQVKYISVPRSENKDADRLVNMALDSQSISS